MYSIVGTQKEMKALEQTFPAEVREEALRIVTMLDECYGADRHVFEDDGGYVCILEEDADIQSLHISYGLDITQFLPEDCRKICDGWLSLLYLWNNEYAVNLFLSEKTSLYEKLLKEWT